MKKVTVSAPGKLILLGEHAVVYNHPCLVTSVNQRMNAVVEVLDEPKFHLEAEDVKITGYKKSLNELGVGDIPRGARFVEIAVKNISKKYRLKTGLRIITKSEFSPQFGFGSSSASAVCAIKAISELFKLGLTPKEIFDLSYRTILDIQGTGSGFDIAAAVYGGTIYFKTGGKKIEPLAVNHLPLIVGYSGIKADTVALINQVKEKAGKYPKIIKKIYSSIEELVELAKIKLIENDLQSFGELMDINQGFLEALGVSSGKLANMIYAARSAGAYGAKLSGAGGGDCIIAIAPKKNRIAVEKAIIKKGGEIISVKTNAEGVRVE